jgi:hypothetical protein
MQPSGTIPGMMKVPMLSTSVFTLETSLRHVLRRVGLLKVVGVQRLCSRHKRMLLIASLTAIPDA